MRWAAIVVTAFVGSFWPGAPAEALSIQGQFLASTGPDGDPGHGGGNIQTLFGAAAQLWEAAILDDVTVTIDYFWDENPGPLGYSFGDGRTGTIGIPNMHELFLDATPDGNEEYATPALTDATLGGTSLNYGVGFTGGAGAAAGFDLFTILLHEIGHVLGSGPNAFPDYADGDVDVTAPRPLAGLSLPVAGGCCHLDTPAGDFDLEPVMFPFIDPGERRWISDADLLFVAQGGGWEQLDSTRFAAVPEPGTLTLLGLGAIGLASRRRASRPQYPFEVRCRLVLEEVPGVVA